MRRFTIALYLHPVADAALIAALEATPRGRRATLVREWLRGGMGKTPDLEADRPDLEGLGLVL